MTYNLSVLQFQLILSQKKSLMLFDIHHDQNNLFQILHDMINENSLLMKLKQ